MAHLIMTSLSLIPAIVFIVLVGYNAAIIIARFAHHDGFARRLQNHLDTVSWVFRVGGGSRRG